MIRILRNPFYIYPASFLLVFVIYCLGWSTLFPSLSFSVITFFLFTFAISIFIGFSVDTLRLIAYRPIDRNTISIKRFIFLIYLGYGIEFLVFREIPLLTLINGGGGIGYAEFGIKVFHVVLATFNSFYLVYLFHLYLSKKKKSLLFYYLMCYIPPILIVNRGMIIIGALTCFFVFLLSLKKNISFKKFILIGVLSLVILYAFGYFGNLRSANSDPDYIPKESAVTDSFLESNIPKEYYWTYLYLGSPLANFQNNVNITDEVDYNIVKLIVMECFPEIISKRLAVVFGYEREGHHQLRKWLTVGTVYSKAYSYAKWLGPIVLFIYGILVMIISLVLVPKSSAYHITAIAIVSTLVFMNTFDNMFTFSGISLQLFYVVLFSLFEGKRFVLGSLAPKVDNR